MYRRENRFAGATNPRKAWPTASPSAGKARTEGYSDPSGFSTPVTYPANNGLANQLKIVAQVIAGNLGTRLFSVQLGGFDTHSAEKDAHTMYGTYPTLEDLDGNGDVKFNADFRSVYAGVLKDVVGADPAPILAGSFDPISVMRA